MIYMINGQRNTASFFWGTAHVIGTERQRYRLLEGLPANLGGVWYQILFEDEEQNEEGTSTPT